MEYLHMLKKPDLDLIWGVIGPSGSLEATANILPFTANSGVITVSTHCSFSSTYIIIGLHNNNYA